MTFVINAVVSKVLGEEKITKKGAMGMICIIIGTTLCTLSKGLWFVISKYIALYKIAES